MAIDKKSAEYKASIDPARTSYLKSLNKKGSANYIPTPDDPGMENMDAINNAAVKAAPGAPVDSINPNPIQNKAPTPTTPGAVVPFDQATKGLQPTGQPKSMIDAAASTLKQKYQQGLGQVLGSQAPASMGAAASTIKSTLPPAEPDTSVLDVALSEDKGWQSLLQAKEEYFNPENQKTSLMDTYNKLYKKSGLSELDEEIIDAKTVIEGTEDDIRNEIEQAGGFGTDSQVQALALSRNKVLLKNYNNLVAMRESKSEHLGTMMNLAEKDRAYADDQFDRMLNFDMQMLNYRDKFLQNTRDQYNKYDPAQLYAMLADNPRQLGFAEKVLGMAPGGLAKAAAYVSPEQKLDLELKKGQLALQQSNLKTDALQRSNIQSQINERNAGKVLGASSTGGLTDANGKPLKLTATQVDTLTGFDNTLGGAQKAQALLDKGVKTGPLQSAWLATAKLIDTANPDQLDMEQTLGKIKADFMKSISGAAVSESEAKRLAKFLPEFGDQEGVIKSKLKNLIEESNKSKTNYLRTLGASGGMGNVVVGPDGNEYEIID